MDLDVRVEPQIDYEETARLANEAFGDLGQAFTARRLAWLYETAFAEATVVLGLFAGERKVGQVTLLGQPFGTGGIPESAAALVDLFILPDFRSREAIGTLYGRVEALCRERGFALILAVPNGKAQSVNRRLLALETVATLDIRTGLAPPLRSRRVAVSAAVAGLGREAAVALFKAFEQQEGTGLQWVATGLWDRLQDPVTAHAVHATEDLLLISAAKTRRRIPMTLICGLLPRGNAQPRASEVRRLVAAACRFHRRPLFVYIGRNAQVPPPGWAVPARLRPSVMIVQAKRVQDDGRRIDLDRFEIVDFDFA